MDKEQLKKRIKDKIEQVRRSKEESIGSSDSDYYYWEGYLTALDYIDDLLIILED